MIEIVSLGFGFAAIAAVSARASSSSSGASYSSSLPPSANAISVGGNVANRLRNGTFTSD
jgi:hypothetical protein